MFLATRPLRHALFTNLDSLFEFGCRPLPASSPTTNIREDEDKFELELAVPGAKKEDFKVFTEKGALHIAYENKSEAEKDGTKRFDYSGLHKRFSLSDNIDVEQIKADYVAGILRLELPKKEVEETKTYIDIS